MAENETARALPTCPPTYLRRGGTLVCTTCGAVIGATEADKIRHTTWHATLTDLFTLANSQRGARVQHVLYAVSDRAPICSRVPVHLATEHFPGVTVPVRSDVAQVILEGLMRDQWPPRRLSSTAACAAMAMVLVACGSDAGSGAPRPPTPTASSTPDPGKYTTFAVTAQIAGRKVVGECAGVNSGKPTVLREVGIGAPRDSLSLIQQHMDQRTLVCSYDRAGKGSSDPPAAKPRPVAEVISDANAFLAEAARQGAQPSYFLVGQSFGGEVVMHYAQAYPDDVAGLVSINPNPPYETWLARARTVQTEAEIQEFEIPFPTGDNEEGVDTTSSESMLTEPLPPNLPYAVMFDEECAGLPPPLQNEADCTRMIDLLEVTAQDLAKVGEGGTYVRVQGGGHDMHLTKPDVVLATVDEIWAKAAP